MTDSVTSLFTFGYGQLCPYTGKDLGDHYALVTAPDRSSARLFMNTAFMRNYAFEYTGPGDPNIAGYVPGMTLHITVNLVPERPMPPGFDYSRADDDPEVTQPIAGRVPAHLEDARTGEVVTVPPVTGAVVTQNCVFTGDIVGWCETHQAVHIASGEGECGCPVYPYAYAGRRDAADTIIDHSRACLASAD